MSEFNFRAEPSIAGPAPAGYRLTERSRVIGSGERAFELARRAVYGWGIQRGSGFVPVLLPDRVAVGAVSRFRVPFGPLRPVVVCRVFAVVDEPRRAGFGHGALRGHPQSGWESFMLEWGADDRITMRIRVVARPSAWWMRLAGPAGALALHLLLGRNLRSLDGLLSPS